MKFGKQLETEAEEFPSEWRPYLIQYKQLKKLITKVAEEIESRGLSTSLLHECLNPGQKDHCLQEDQDENDVYPKIRYYFTGESPNVKPNIEFSYDPKEPHVQDIISRLLGNHTEEVERPKLEFKRSINNRDFFSLSSEPEDDQKEKTIQSPTSKNFKRRNSTVMLVKELLNLTLEERSRKPQKRQDPTTTEDEEEVIQEVQSIKEEREYKTLVIELDQDDEFFKMLMDELQQAATLQDVTTTRFKEEVTDLQTRMTKIAAPKQKTDMYNWRKIFSIYMDAQIFQGNAESDRSFRSVERAKKQMVWFMGELNKSNLLNNLKSKESKQVFQQFMELNTELITIKHYQVLNQTAMRKILKKHDKRSGLNASQSFPMAVHTDKLLFSPKLASVLYAAITSKLTTIIPQPDDYACPVCMCVFWRPIRLSCSHVFCVRCLIKQQRLNKDACPMCRHPTAVKDATALNLDKGLETFLKMYFPKEIKEKKRDNEKEQAIEDVQALTGRRYTEEQLMRMMNSNNSFCQIM